MSLITELVQLFKQLDTEITDRRIRDHFVPIKEKFLELREEQFRLEQEHVKQISELKSAHEGELTQLKSRLKKLEEESVGQNEECPFCKRRTFEVVDIQPHQMMAEVGVKTYFYKCSNCQRTTERDITPGFDNSGSGGRPRRR